MVIKTFDRHKLVNTNMVIKTFDRHKLVNTNMVIKTFDRHKMGTVTNSDAERQ